MKYPNKQKEGERKKGSNQTQKILVVPRYTLAVWHFDKSYVEYVYILMVYSMD